MLIEHLRAGYAGEFYYRTYPSPPLSADLVAEVHRLVCLNPGCIRAKTARATHNLELQKGTSC